MEKFYFAGSNGKSNIAAYAMKPNDGVKALVYFAHGVTEYAERHMELYKQLCASGYAVVANDHMGHGDSIGKYPMYFEGRNEMSGWECACNDAYKCIYEAKKVLKLNQHVPVYGIGFSLGSFIVQYVAIRNPDLFDKIVLLGTGCQTPIEIALGKAMAASESKKHGATNSTPQVSKLTFETYNKYFEGDTRADWLCANRNSLYTYLGDLKCGDNFTAGLFYDLLCGMEYAGKQANINNLNPNMQVLMISGEKDAVGNFTKGVIRLKKKYEKAGLRPVVDFYKYMRHDVLHETRAEAIREQIVGFLEN